VVNTIREVAKGNQPISEAIRKPEIASRILDDFTAYSSLGEEAGKLLAHLTPREAEILHQIADGNTKEQIASTLGITDEALDKRLHSAQYKLVVNDQKLMVIEMAQSGLPAISRVSFTGKPGTEYITKEEFAAFKESLKERFKFLSGDIS